MVSKDYFQNILFERIVSMYTQPIATTDLVDNRIADLRRSARASERPARSDVRRHGFAAPLPARRRAGWWLVTVGLRLAVGPAQPVRSASAR